MSADLIGPEVQYTAVPPIR